MIRFEGEELSNEFESAFGYPMDELTVAQLWWIVKIGKHIRGRCRSNVALNNYMNRNFDARFIEIEKIDTRTEQKYKGLEIRK